jgi:hypothetical protein
LSLAGGASSIHRTALLIDSDDFATDDQARQAGEDVIARLLVSATRLVRGLDISGPTSHDAETIALPADRGQVVDDLDGLNVYSVDGAFTFSPHFHMYPTTNADRLASAVAEAAPLPLEGKLRIAHELFAAALIHEQPSVRFLFLVSVLDCLAECELRDEQAVSCIDKLRAALQDMDAGPTDKQQIDHKLVEAKRESITSAIRRMAVEAVGETYHGVCTRRLIGDCYAIRSTIVHDGEYDHAQLDRYEGDLQYLVSMVLRKLASREAQ